MSELTHYPLARALLIELLDLSAVDEQLPLALLVGMYRHVLRAPLLALAASVEFSGASSFPPGADADFDVMHELYPETLISHGRHWDQLDGLYARLNPLAQPLRQQAGLGVDRALTAIFRQADRQWVGTWPAILLHRLTWGEADLAPILGMLELVLGTDPMVGRGLLLQARMGTA